VAARGQLDSGKLAAVLAKYLARTGPVAQKRFGAESENWAFGAELPFRASTGPACDPAQNRGRPINPRFLEERIESKSAGRAGPTEKRSAKRQDSGGRFCWRLTMEKRPNWQGELPWRMG